MTTSTTGFVGWHRPHNRSRWHPVCHGDSAEVVLSKLLDNIRGGDKCVLAANVDANDPQRRVGRR